MFLLLNSFKVALQQLFKVVILFKQLNTLKTKCETKNRLKNQYQGCQKTQNPGRTWNLRNVEKKPEVLNNLYMLSSKISI